MYSEFVNNNDLIIKQADKNAGICIMRRIDYNEEVLKQLNNENIYRPSTVIEYDLSTCNYLDKVNYYDKLYPALNLKYFCTNNFSPCKFYILPKVHKPFFNFPTGRPISSTKNSINQGISMLIDTILRPLIPKLADVVIDSSHFMLLLNNVILDRDKKYVLLVADINSMYTELPIDICKEQCISLFQTLDNKNNTLNITPTQLKLLLSLSLDYSYVQFNNQIYFQHKGIQMGNCSSVTIANITACAELKSIWAKEIIFKARFIDDIFCIVDITNICNVDEWVTSTFNHKFLKFDVNFDTTNINFLDLWITIKNNYISTTTYKKPMNKHQFLHYSSNHPRFMLNNLPFACGLRMIKNNSENTLAMTSIMQMFYEFSKRGYPDDLLNYHFQKLCNMDRFILLTPKSNLVISHLRMNNPQILITYNIINDDAKIVTSNKNYTFIALPYYNIHKYKSTVLNYIKKCLCNYSESHVKDFNIKIGYYIPDSLEKFTRNLEK